MGSAKPGAKHRDDCRPEVTAKFGNTVMIPNTDEFKLLADSLIKKEREHLDYLQRFISRLAERPQSRRDDARRAQSAARSKMTQADAAEAVLRERGPMPMSGRRSLSSRRVAFLAFQRGCLLERRSDGDVGRLAAPGDVPARLPLLKSAATGTLISWSPSTAG